MAPRQAQFCENYSFMTCLLWVDTSSSGWQKDVQKVLKNIHEVTTFRMNGLGMVEVSGTVNPQRLMKKLSKKLAIVWFQFGDCAANLFRPPPPTAGGYGGGGGRGLGSDGRFLHFDDFASRMNDNPFLSNDHRTNYNRHCSVRGNAKITRCRVSGGGTIPPIAAGYMPSAPPLPNDGGCGGINGCCLM